RGRLPCGPRGLRGPGGREAWPSPEPVLPHGVRTGAPRPAHHEVLGLAAGAQQVWRLGPSPGLGHLVNTGPERPPRPRNQPRPPPNEGEVADELEHASARRKRRGAAPPHYCHGPSAAAVSRFSGGGRGEILKTAGTHGAVPARNY